MIKTQNIQNPEEIIEKYPNNSGDFIRNSREISSDIIHKKDSRLLTIVGPCSIHNSDEAIEYATKLKEIEKNYPNLFIVMRVYFEKPRTTIGWKGLINDPDLDGSNNIELGLEKARELLVKINELLLPCATEFLDNISHNYFSDLITWGAIGARTTESQIHREMASGLGLPIGFKNSTNGSIQIALDAIKSSKSGHNFLGLDSKGKCSITETSGNPDGHVILRGGNEGPNYNEESIKKIALDLEKSQIDSGIMIDFSHGNSLKKWENQSLVASSIGKQIGEGNSNIIGVMIESNLNAGNQSFTPGKDSKHNLNPGISITDECVPFDKTLEILKVLDRNVGERNNINY